MPRRFTLRQLEYFVAVGQAGSIAAASEAINVSSPSISAAIAQLEAEFGIQLFVRQHAQGLSLTPGGRRFFGEAKLLLEAADGLHDLAADIAARRPRPDRHRLLRHAGAADPRLAAAQLRGRPSRASG